MPGLNDPNDVAFTSGPNAGKWTFNRQKNRWETNDPVTAALMGAVPDALGISAQQIQPGAPGAELNQGQSGDDRSRMAGYLTQLQGQASTGSGAWEQALAANTNKTKGVAEALGQSTPGEDPMAATRSIGNARIGADQRAVGQGNLLRAQTQQQAQGQLSDALGGQAASDAQTAGASAAANQGVLQANRSLASGADKSRRDLVGGFGQAMMAGLSKGGEVPGTPEVFGDDERNDKVHALLSPDEIVIPISITSRPDAPQAAAAFVEAIKARGASGKTHFDGGGEVPGFTGSDIDTGTPGLKNDPTSNVISSRPLAPGTAAKDANDINAQAQILAGMPQDPSIKNGALLDTRNYDATRGANLANTDRFAEAYAGRGPSVAPQMMQNATDSTVADAMRATAGSGRPMDVTGAAAEQLQSGAGNAAGTVAGESQRGGDAFAHALQRQREQDLAISTAKQQAAWRNTMMNAGLGLEQQAQIKGLLGAAGQGAVAVGSMFDKPSGESSHYDTGTGRYDTTPAWSDPGIASQPGEWEQPFAEGGVVAHLSRQGTRAPVKRATPKRGQPLEPRGLDTSESNWGGSPDEWTPFEGRREKRDYGTQFEDSPVQQFADGGIARLLAGPEAPSWAAPQSDAPWTNTPEPYIGPTPGQAPAIALANGKLVRAPVVPQAPLRFTSPTGQFGVNGVPPESPGAPQPAVPPSPAAKPAPMPVKPAAAKPASPSGKLRDAPEVAPDAYAMERQAASEKAAAEGAQSQEAVRVLSDLQKAGEVADVETAQRQQRARMDADSAMADIRKTSQDLAAVSTNVDPGKYMNDRGWAGKLASVVGLVLGSIGNDNGVNRAANLLGQQIDRDIDAQKASHELALRKGQAAVAGAQTYYSLMRQKGLDDVAASLAAKDAAYDSAKTQLQLAAAKAGQPLAQAALHSAYGAIDEKQKANAQALHQTMFENGIKKQHANAATMSAEAALLAAGKDKSGAAAQAGFVAPGFELRPDAHPKPEELEKWRTARAAADDIKNKATQLREMIAGNDKTGAKPTLGGLAGMYGPERAKAEALISSLKVAGKNAYGLGALSEPDTRLLMEGIADPTGVAGLFSGNKGMVTKLDQFIANADSTVTKAGDTLGIVKSTPQSTQPATHDAAPTATGEDGKKYRLSPDGKSWVSAP